MLPAFILGLSSFAVEDAPRYRVSLNTGWKFYQVEIENGVCTEKVVDDYTGKQCHGLVKQAQVTDENWCRSTCCGLPDCEVFQWTGRSCSTGSRGQCSNSSSGLFLARRDIPVQNFREGDSGMDDETRKETARTIRSVDSAFYTFDYDDSNWESVRVPHDMLIGISVDAGADKAHGYVPYSKGWYRLKFKAPQEITGRKVWLEFTGVMGFASIYLNHEWMTNHSNGYTSFHVDATKVIQPGKWNTLALSVDASMPDSWWYDGGGLYRGVSLLVAGMTHIRPWGVYLPALVEGPIAENGLRAAASVKAQVEVQNDKADSVDVRARIKVYRPDGALETEVTSSRETIPAGGSTTLNADFHLPQAKLWSLENPKIYSTVTQLFEGDSDAPADVMQNQFGVRQFEWTADEGFKLNGKAVKIKGFANHQDFAGVGVAVPDSVQGYRVNTLKEMGANAWRTAHNPPTPALLEQCDSQGMLVWDEHHRLHDSPDQLEALRDMLRRDRNHPSVFMWSLCNEALCEGFNATTARTMKAVVNEEDPYGQRVVSAAMNGGFHSSNFAQVLDAVGVNYNIPEYQELHDSWPKKPLLSSESSSDFSDRSVYTSDPRAKRYVSAYDVNYPMWGSTAEDAWCNVSNKKYMAGGFYWTGFDYKGEPTPYGWPNVNSHFGVIDIAGFPKDNFYYHQSVFFEAGQKPVLHVLPHWNWGDGDSACVGFCMRIADDLKSVNVWAYTNGDEVELFLNNKSLGRRLNTPCRHVEWDVMWTAGVLRAEAYASGGTKPLIVKEVETTGLPAKLRLSWDWPSRNNMERYKMVADDRETALLRVELVDAEGRMVPTASAHLEFHLTGPGRIIGLGNGDPSSHESDKPVSDVYGKRKAWNGLARALVQASSEPGNIEVMVTAPGFDGATIRLATVRGQSL